MDVLTPSARTRRRRLVLGLTGLVAAALAAGWVGGGTSSTPDIELTSERARVSTAPQPAERAGGDHDTDRLTRRLDHFFASVGPKRPDGLSSATDRGALGWFGDRASGFTVAVTSDADIDALRDSILGDTSGGAGSLTFRRLSSSIAEFREAWTQVTAGRWRTTGRESWTMDIDVRRGTIRVDTSPLEPATRASLEAIAPGLVDVRVLSEADAPRRSIG